MRLLLGSFVCSALVTGAGAQWYPPSSASHVTVVYPPPQSPPPTAAVIIRARPVERYVQTSQVTYLIAFKNGVVRLAEQYWVNGNDIYYLTADHQQMTALVDNVDVGLSQQLNRERNVVFSLPAEQQETIARSEVLFDTDKYSLKPGAREKMAKLSGVLLAYPGLKIEVEGHTDSVGSDEYNEQLSEERAEAVRDYLLSQGVPESSVTAVGLGKAAPVASNETAAGRRQNRRAEIVVSGVPIGTGITEVLRNRQ